MQEERRSSPLELWLRLGGIQIAALLLVLSGCHSIRVHTDYDETARFDDLRSFAWLEPPVAEDAHPFADNTLLRKRLRASIESHLSERGYRLVEDAASADFLATYSVTLEERIRSDGTVGVGYGGYRGWGYSGAYSTGSVRNYQESTLIIDLIDASSNELVWRGWGSGVVGTRDRERDDARIDDGVRQILNHFPPDPPSD